MALCGHCYAHEFLHLAKIYVINSCRNVVEHVFESISIRNNSTGESAFISRPSRQCAKLNGNCKKSSLHGNATTQTNKKELFSLLFTSTAIFGNQCDRDRADFYTAYKCINKASETSAHRFA